MRAKFKFFLTILFFVGIMVFLLSSDIFSLKKIYVTGNKTIPKDDIINLSRLQYGQNLFKMNKKKIYKNLFNNPKIKAIRIKRVLPSGISLDIIEREAIAAIPYLGSFLNIDEEALIVEVTGLSQRTGIPIVEGLSFEDFKTGEEMMVDNKEQLDTAMEILLALKNADLSKEINLINVKDIENIELISNADINIIIRNHNLDYKIQMAKLIMDDLIKNDKKGTIDMKHEGNPIFRERE
jgi:cell division protein FtsQ